MRSGDRVIGSSGDREDKTLPRMIADDRGWENTGSGDRVIGSSGDRKSKTLPRINADNRGFRKNLVIG